MSELIHNSAPDGDGLEDRSRALLRLSVDNLDLRTRTRLVRVRQAALLTAVSPREWRLSLGLWTPVAGVTAAVALAAALWMALPLAPHGWTAADLQPNLEDLDVVASSDENSGDSIEMLQNDLDFYDFADKAVSSEPAA